MDEYTYEEAKQAAAKAAQDLRERKIHPFSVGSTGSRESIQLGFSYIAHGVYVEVDVDIGHPETTAAPGKYNFGIGSWERGHFFALVCGLYDRLPESWRQRITFWKWVEPEQWKQERAEWRKDRIALVNAAEQDRYVHTAIKYAALKRKWDKVEKAVDEDAYYDADCMERIAKRARLTDEQVLKERESQRGVALPDDNDDDI
jgi:hypothetical protein